MNIIRLSGGIGNQLFQIAFAYAHINVGNKVKIDTSYFENKGDNTKIFKLIDFNLEIANTEEVQKFSIPKTTNSFSKIIIKLRMVIGLRILSLFSPKPIYFHQGRLNLYKNYWPMIRDVYFDGTFINRLLVENVLEQIKLAFKSYRLSEESRKIQNNINSFNSVSVHFRQGDYIDAAKQGFFILDQDYYKKAKLEIETRVSNPYFFIFSSYKFENLIDIFGTNCIFINVTSDSKDLEEMILMSSCNHNIIANSTFSLWASYLNNNENKMVIGPDKWMRQHYSKTTKILPIEAIIIKAKV